MVRAYHVIFTAYGFWLPNDPRGSGSDYVASWELYRFGAATKVTTRHSLANVEHDAKKRLAAKFALKFPPVQFTGAQARAIGRGFAASAKRGRVEIWACAILPEHIHMVIARHDVKIEWIVNMFKGAATKSLIAEDLHPFAQFSESPPSCWARNSWHVFLNTDEQILRAMRYVEQNPVREGKPQQTWSFVKKPTV